MTHHHLWTWSSHDLILGVCQLKRRWSGCESSFCCSCSLKLLQSFLSVTSRGQHWRTEASSQHAATFPWLRLFLSSQFVPRETRGTGKHVFREMRRHSWTTAGSAAQIHTVDNKDTQSPLPGSSSLYLNLTTICIYWCSNCIIQVRMIL